MRKYLILFLTVITIVSCSQRGQLNSEGLADLKVLYVGGQPDVETMGGRTHSAEESENSILERMASFETFLKSKFTVVEVIRGKNYAPEMSDTFDVTIFDGHIPVIEQAFRGYDINGNQVYNRARMLPYDFNRAAITIASMSEVITRAIGSKNDWYCLCLDADAHNWVEDHPIFHGPFTVSMTTRMEPTPDDAFYYTYFTGNLPDSTKMWRVQQKGYMDDRSTPIGMVARPWGYVENEDSEYISSGVCAKSIDAVAIGRHGNFLHWGFAAAPNNMTEEAKQVFANAVVYISNFNGEKMLVRKHNDRIATREYIKECKYLATMPPYEERVTWTLEANEEGLKMQASAREKQRKGHQLNQTEQYYLNFVPQTPMTLEEYLKRYLKEAFTACGSDLEKYLPYYDENLPYFYGGEGSYVLSIDEDCKAWGIDNHDVKLLDMAISCLEKGDDIERAKRILDRYTLCDFETAKEWRAWYKKYRKKMFFTESGGWVFMISGPSSLPGNDAYARIRRNAEAERQQEEQTSFLSTPTYEDPVSIAAKWVSENKGGYIELSFSLYQGFRLYKEVSSKDPFTPLSVGTSAPAGIFIGELITPPSRPLGNRGNSVYENDFTISIPVDGGISGPVTCTISWQSCDDKICLPPQKREFKVMVRQ